MRSRLRWVALALLALVLAVVWNRANAIAVGMIVSPGSFRRESVTPPHDVRDVLEVERAGARIRSWVFEPESSRVMGATLPMTVGPQRDAAAAASAAVRGTIVVLHGIRDSKLGSLGAARSHAARGYRTLIWDARGHGESTGRFLSYGVHEARDLVAVLDALEHRGRLARPLYVVGSSYGGAIALQHAALDRRVVKVVALAPFASLREVVPAYLRWQLGGLAALIPQTWVDARVSEAGHVAGFDPDRACPRCVAQQLTAAVLLIHSKDDERIPYVHSQEIRAALGPRARLMLVSGVGHVAVGNAPGVQSAVETFLDSPLP